MIRFFRHQNVVCVGQVLVLLCTIFTRSLKCEIEVWLRRLKFIFERHWLLRIFQCKFKLFFNNLSDTWHPCDILGKVFIAVHFCIALFTVIIECKWYCNFLHEKHKNAILHAVIHLLLENSMTYCRKLY